MLSIKNLHQWKTCQSFEKFIHKIYYTNTFMDFRYPLAKQKQIVHTHLTIKFTQTMYLRRNTQKYEKRNRKFLQWH